MVVGGETTFTIGRETMDENFSKLFDAIFGLFESVSRLGAEWGEPWGWLLPVFVGLVVALGFVGGTRYAFEKAQEKVRPVFFLVLGIVGLLALLAIQETNRQNRADNGIASEEPSHDG